MTAPAVHPESEPAPGDREGAVDTALAGRETLGLVGSGVVLALLYPGVGLADALFTILW